MAQKKNEKWIQQAVQREGRVRELAKKEGGLTRDGKIDSEWLEKRIKTTKDKSLKAALILARRLKSKIGK